MHRPSHKFGESYDRSLEATDRRNFLAGIAAGTIAAGAAGWGLYEALGKHPPVAGPTGQSPFVPAAHRLGLGIPGPFPGRVVEVNHPGAVHENRRDQAVVKQMLGRGLKELVGADDPVQAWRYFFQVGDRVGIKVVPVGKPHSISSYEVVREIVAGLQSAGVRLRDILVFERYKDEFIAAGYPPQLPDGVYWECSSAAYDEAQLEITGQLPGQPRQSRVAGYDRDVYREEPYCDIDPKKHHPSDDRRFRSHLSQIISRKIDKFISIPVLKDHRSAGVTLSLKNLSHGSVNNVARSHIPAFPGLAIGAHGQESTAGSLNQCNQFIPAMVSLPPIREKAVLQILDGLVATYEGGPGDWNPTFATWEHKSLFFATDPVAIDRVGWEIIDRKRAEMGLSPVGAMGTLGDANFIERDGERRPTESFHHRQPQHVSLAATLGLGFFDPAQVKHQRIDLGDS